jgi:hypothetical protein
VLVLNNFNWISTRQIKASPPYDTVLHYYSVNTKDGTTMQLERHHDHHLLARTVSPIITCILGLGSAIGPTYWWPFNEFVSSLTPRSYTLASYLVPHHRHLAKALFGFWIIQFNSHHINVAANAWSTKCRLIACMSAQIRSNLRNESIKPN